MRRKSRDRQQAKIIPRILGGLGNQLFIYAAARRLSLVSGAELVIDDVSGFERDFKYQRSFALDRFNISARKATPHERMEPFPRLRRFLVRRVDKQRPFNERGYIQQEGVDFDPRLLNYRPRGNVHLEGYWQSEQYFKDVESSIREELRIIPPADKVNLALAERIRNVQAVAVHVRFFNASQTLGVNNAPSDYYARAVARMENLAPGAHYFVFSDEPSAARAQIPLPDNRVTLVVNNQGDDKAYADLWLMTQFRNLIIANSTFSWWGAWLSSHNDKSVIAPHLPNNKNGVAWSHDGIIPPLWNAL